MPDIVFTLSPVLRGTGFNADRHRLICAGQRNRFLGQHAARDTQRQWQQHREPAHRERRVSLAFAEAAATCVSNRRTDRHPCQSSDQRRACVAQFSRMPAASFQSKTPPAITKKVATKIAADYKCAETQGSSRVRLASKPRKLCSIKSLRSMIAMHFVDLPRTSSKLGGIQRTAMPLASAPRCPVMH